MTYCDTSFLLPLYIQEMGASEKARKIAASWKDAPWVSPLGELELTNAICRKVFEKQLGMDAARDALKLFRDDQKSGIFRWSHLNLAVMFRDASTLALQRTPQGGHRSLDVLHVSAAKLLGTTRFLSLDDRLNQLAKLEGMKVLSLKS
jgi:predicted nucleic acid-binding protein